ncbi:MAG: siphovirus Gp157 family protein [Anaerotignaceae bacterium]
MASIYEITGDWLEVQNLILEGEIDEETLKNTLECIGCEFEDKAVAIAKMRKNTSGVALAIKAEENRLADRRKAIENANKHLNDILYEAMKITGKTKFKTDLFTFAIQKNPPSLKLVDGVEIPKEYLIEQTPTVDTATIKEEIKAGAKFDFAELVQGESLRIK